MRQSKNIFVEKYITLLVLTLHRPNNLVQADTIQPPPQKKSIVANDRGLFMYCIFDIVISCTLEYIILCNALNAKRFNKILKFYFVLNVGHAMSE